MRRIRSSIDASERRASLLAPIAVLSVLSSKTKFPSPVSKRFENQDLPKCEILYIGK